MQTKKQQEIEKLQALKTKNLPEKVRKSVDERIKNIDKPVKK